MGLFSTKKKVYVASTVYKIVDDGSSRTTFMREVIASTALSNNSFAEAITQAHMRGPRSSQRAFFRWARTNFDIGMPRAAINYTEVIDEAVLAAEILDEDFGGDTDITITINESFIDNADESYYAERWIYENRPELAIVDWAADVDPVTNDIWIQYPPGTEYLGSPISSESFSEPDFDSSDTVLVAYYTAQDIALAEPDPVKVFIYKIGSGNTTLDNYDVELEDGTGAREFYPFIPLRINNKAVFEAGSPALPHQDIITKAYKKGLGTDIDEAIASIATSDDLADIDYAYLVFGVCLNTTNKFEKTYLFEFFRQLATRQGTTPGDFDDYVDVNDDYGYHPEVQDDDDVLNDRALNDITNPGYLLNVDRATRSVAPRISNIHLKLPSPDLGVLDMKISWTDISEAQYTGVIFQGAKVGDVEIKKGISYGQTVSLGFMNGIAPSISTVNGLVLRKQISRLEYIEVICRGLLHKNLIYKGKSVDITSNEALDDDDDSGFIVPLHEPTLKKIGVVAATEVARESYLMVFNSYKVVKKKWYQTGFFAFILAIIVIVVAVVLTIIFGPAGASAAAAANAGILGSSAAIGAALGFSGLLAIAIGTAANAIAAALVLQLVSAGATELFGAKIGAIITAIAAVTISLGSGPGGFSSANIASNIGNMASIDKLLAITNAATNIVGVFQQAELESILAEIKKSTDAYKTEMASIEKLWEELGFGNGLIDPTMLTDFSNPLDTTRTMGEFFTVPSTFSETMDEFLNRTLLTGSELIEMSHSMVSDLVTLTLTLK